MVKMQGLRGNTLTVAASLVKAPTVTLTSTGLLTTPPGGTFAGT
jgi:hypothetical protein